MSASGAAKPSKDADNALANKEQPQTRPVDVFVSYSHQDRFWKDWIVQTRLNSTLVGTVEVWSDDEIDPSADWRHEIKTALKNARIAVLIVTKNFMNSSFIQTEELRTILERRQDSSAKVFWIPVDTEGTAKMLKHTGLVNIQAAWPPDQPLVGLRKSPELLEAARAKILMNIESALDPSGARLRKALDPREYELVRRIGEGQSRALFLARDHIMKRWVSISALKDTEDLEEFRRGIISSSLVDGLDGFITVHSAHTNDNPPHCVMQYVDGETVASRLLHGPMQYSYVRDVLLQLAEGLRLAHRRDFYHLNIKPSNVLIDQNDRALLSPLSRTPNYYNRLNKQWKELPEGDEDKVYAIPEFFGRTIRRADSAKSDQYLLGMLGYHMITGKPPERIAAGRQPKSMQDFNDLAPINSLEDCRSCPDVLASGIMRMSARDPEERFETLDAAIQCLARFRNESLVTAKDSFMRIAATQDWESKVIQKFYRDLVAQCSNPGVFSNFEDVNWSRQYEMLKEAVLLLLVFCEFDAANPKEPTVLSRIKGKHADLRIAAGDFDLFQKLLIENLIQHDPQCQDDVYTREMVAKAWRKSLTPGIEFMKSHMNH